MYFNIRGQFLRPASGQAGENDPRRVVFENSLNSTKVRVSADSHGLGDQGLGTGLVVRGAAVVKSTIMVFWILAGMGSFRANDAADGFYDLFHVVKC